MGAGGSDGGPVVVLGLGYVGLPLALALAESGKPTIGFDVDHTLIERLRLGESHVGDVSGERLRKVVDRALTLTAVPEEVAGATAYVICVPTPLSSGGRPDTSFITAAVEVISPHVKPGILVILESTSYPGTTEELVARPLEAASGLQAGLDFCVAFSPERIDPGNPSFGLANTPKIVSGLRECCRDRAAELYGRVAETLVPATGIREAELAKLLENTYRQVNIALMNEMSVFCRALDIDLYEAIRCASTKPFGFHPFYPGPGVGGHCIPIDPKFLASHVHSQLGYAFRFVELAQEINDSMPRYVVNRLEAELGGSLRGMSVVVLGVTYKADVADLRQTPSEDIVRALRERGAESFYIDPYVEEWRVDGIAVPEWPQVSAERADASILVQYHSGFRSVDLADLASICLDTRGVLSGPHVRRL